MGMRYQEVPNDHMMRLLDLQLLNTHLDVADLAFLHELEIRYSMAIDCLAFFAKINLRIPGPTRSWIKLYLLSTEPILGLIAVWPYG